MLISENLVAMLNYSQIYFPYVKAKNKPKTKNSKPPPPRKKKTNKQTKNKENKKNKNKLKNLTLYFIFSLFIDKVNKLLLTLLIHHL